MLHKNRELPMSDYPMAWVFGALSARARNTYGFCRPCIPSIVLRNGSIIEEQKKKKIRSREGVAHHTPCCRPWRAILCDLMRSKACGNKGPIATHGEWCNGVICRHRTREEKTGLDSLVGQTIPLPLPLQSTNAKSCHPHARMCKVRARV